MSWLIFCGYTVPLHGSILVDHHSVDGECCVSPTHKYPTAEQEIPDYKYTEAHAYTHQTTHRIRHNSPIHETT
jgi:hypothetical protein